MGYHDSETHYPLQFFLVGSEMSPEGCAQVSYVYSAEGRGAPIHNLASLEAVNDDLRSEAVVRLQYDRFSPRVTRRGGH